MFAAAGAVAAGSTQTVTKTPVLAVKTRTIKKIGRTDGAS